MNCEKALEALWPPERPRVAGDEVIRAREHVESCPSCRALLEADLALRRILASLPLPKAPPEVRERVFEALAMERARAAEGVRSATVGKPPRPLSWDRLFPWNLARGLGLAAVVTAPFVAGAYLAGGLYAPQGTAPSPVAYPPPAAPELEDVEEFVRFAVQEQRVASSDPGRVLRFLARELDLLFHPRHIEGFEILGVEICSTDEKRGAVILYERNGQVLYHYVLQNDGAAPRDPAPSDATPLRWSDSTSPSAVTWSDGGVEEALVGNVPAGRLMAIVRELRSPGAAGGRGGPTGAPRR